MTGLSDLPPIRDSLEAHGLNARKSFGQHFLLDLNITRKIARLAGVGPGDHVIEVGPGPGGLTRALLETGADVTAIEMDLRFQPLLEPLASAAPGQFDLVWNDALKVDETALASGRPTQIVANLPYNVGTALLIKWLTGTFRPRDMTLMFQREVAHRIIAQPGSEAYGRLAVLVQATATAAIMMDVTARAFTPPPRVESAVVQITPFTTQMPLTSLSALERVTAAAFGQRRKMLRSSLKALGGDRLCELASIDAARRAETLTIAEFIALARGLDVVAT